MRVGRKSVTVATPFPVGKRNFFTFGEAKSGDEKILAAYTGRYSADADG